MERGEDLFLLSSLSPASKRVFLAPGSPSEGARRISAPTVSPALAVLTSPRCSSRLRFPSEGRCSKPLLPLEHFIMSNEVESAPGEVGSSDFSLSVSIACCDATDARESREDGFGLVAATAFSAAAATIRSASRVALSRAAPSVGELVREDDVEVGCFSSMLGVSFGRSRSTVSSTLWT